MHILQPKQRKLSNEESEKLLKKYNISRTQLPKIKISDPSLSDDFEIGDIVEIEREKESKKFIYYRVVIV